ncbi:MAG TPA: helix-turn-helix transcriptional regulator [Gammaproteobacteria bacterium]
MSKKLKKAFGSAMKATRKRAGLSQLRLSALSGLDRTYISDLERGEFYASLDTIFRLADAMKVSAAEIIKRTADELDK